MAAHESNTIVRQLYYVPLPAVQQITQSIRAAHNHTAGVRTFYIASESKPGVQYVVQFIRRAHQCRWFCDCADFKFRRLARRRHCKHLHELTAMAREAHGVARLARTISAEVAA